MSRQQSASFQRRITISSAVSPLFEGLEQRNHFSATPTANPGGPYTIAEGQNLTVSGLGSTDSDGTVAQYQWDTNYSASRGFRNKLTQPTWIFSPSDSGSRTIALRVVDNSGDVSSVQTTTINITDVAPTLTLNLPGNAQEGLPTSVSWSYSDPGVSDVVTGWNVDWGDGTNDNYAGTATGSAHTYDTDGNYSVTLTATQADATTSVSQTLSVANVTPIVIASTPNATIDEGGNARVNFYSPNRAGTLDGWSVDWGDGSIQVMTADHTHANHVYADNGNYTAIISAQEYDGGKGSTTVAFTVNNVAPAVTQTNVPATGTEGTPITIGSTATDVGVNDTLTYGWTIYRDNALFTPANGTVLNTSSLTFTPTDNGSYVARLSVMDKDGAVTTVNSSPIIVGNVAPTATITGTPGGSVVEGSVVSLTAAAADAGTEDVLSYAWTVAKDGAAYILPGGTVTTAAAFAFTPRDNGTYVATVVVSDDDGATVSVSTTAITVTNAAPTATVTGLPATANEGDSLTLTSHVTDPGADDTQTYAWGVEKLSGAGNGTITTGPYGRGELSTFDWGTNFTLTARMNVSSANADGVHYVLYKYNTYNFNVTLIKSGSNYSISVNDNQNHTITTAANAVTPDTMFDLAVSYNSSTGATAIYLDGAVAGSGTLGTNLGGSEHSHLIENLAGTFDQIGFYHDTLTAQDVANLHTDTAITTAPFELWNFSEAAGSYTAVGINGRTVGSFSGATFSGSSSFQPYVLPGNPDLTGQTLTFVPPDNGTYRVKLNVTDKDGASVNTQTSSIVVANVAPTAVITDAPATSPEGTAVTVGSTVTDPGVLDTQTYAWSVTKNGATFALPGGTVTNAAGFTFTPTDNGAYVISLTVTDKDGGTMTTTSAVGVENAPPVVTITGLPSGTSDEGVAINLGSTAVDPGASDTVASYTWSITKDGEAYTLPNGTVTNTSTFAFTPDDNGEYAVKLVVIDNDGGSTEKTETIDVANVAPTAAVSGEPGSSINENTPVTLDVTASDVAADTISYAWTVTKDGVAYPLPGGTVTTGTSLTFTPNDAGDYVATCVASDEDGGSTPAASLSITVINSPPVVTVASPATGVEGTSIHGTSTVTDGVSDTHTYQWTAQHLVAGGTVDGVLYNDGSGQNGSLANYDMGTSFTVLTRLKVDSSVNIPDDREGLLLFGSSEMGKMSVRLITYYGSPHIAIGENGSASPLIAFIGSDQFVDCGVGYDGTTGDAYLYVAGQRFDYGGSYSTGLAGVMNSVTVSNDFPGSIDYLAHYQSVLSEADANTVFAGNTIGTAAYNRWDFGETEGTPTATSTGTNADVLTLGSGQTYVGGATWETVTVSGSSTGSGFDFTPPDNGTYRLKLTVTDQLSQSTTAYGPNVVVANANPTGSIAGPTTAGEGAAVTLTATAADAGVADTLTYAWTVTKDGQSFTLPNGTATTAAGFTFTPPDQGSYVATCVVTDKDGGTVSLARTLTVSNVPPTVAITTTPASGTEGSPLTFVGTASDSAGDTLTYGWSVYRNGVAFPLPNGTTTNAATFTFTPTDDGSYVARLTVSDEDGGTTTVNSTAVVVTDVVPVVTLTGATTGTEGQAIAFTGSATDVGPADQAAGFTYAWTVKRGTTTVATGANAAFNYTPAVHGTYTVKLVVTDKDGRTSTQQSTLTVANVAPSDVTLTGTRTGLVEGNAVSLTAGATDASGDTVSYAWQAVRNGTVFATGDTANVNFTAARGNYDIVVTATDTAGATASHTFGMVVGNVAPTGVVTAPTGNVLIGTSASFGLSVADVPSSQSLTVTFDYGDGSPAATATMTNGQSISLKHKYAAVRGLYTVTATINDGVSTTTLTKQVFVAEAAMISDPWDAGKQALIVLGSDANDTIDVSQQSNGKYAVMYNGTNLGTSFTPETRTYVYGNGGANTISVNGTTNAVVFAGGAGSNVTTGAGNDYISGSDSADRISSGTGNDVLIGGNGPDTLRGGAGDDLLVAAIHYQANDTQKAVAMANAWSGAQTIAARKAAMKSLFSKQLVNDAGGNQLFGEAGNDWFVLNTGIDKLKDLQATDLVN